MMLILSQDYHLVNVTPALSILVEEDYGRGPTNLVLRVYMGADHENLWSSDDHEFILKLRDALITEVQIQISRIHLFINMHSLAEKIQFSRG